jgi:alpha-glucosidase
MIKKFVLAAILVALSFDLGAKTYELTSPDGKNVISVNYDASGLTYSLAYDGKHQFASTPVSMHVENSVWGAPGERVRKVIRSSVESPVVFPVPRKYYASVEKYNSMKLVFGDFDVEFRAYNDGVAYRFVGKLNRSGRIMSEVSGYRFDKDYEAYVLLTKGLQCWYEEDYTVANLSNLPKDRISLTPLMVTTENARVLLSESDFHNYSGSYLKTVEDGFDLVLAAYPAAQELRENGSKRIVTEREDYIVESNLNRTFPWRVAGVFPLGNDAAILNSELIYLLGERTKDDYSWVKPGKLLWDWWNCNNIIGVDFKAGINTETYRYLIDYAAAHKFEYVLFDEGWSGKNDLLTLNPNVDMPYLCRYATEKGVGVCLWSNWVTMDRQLIEALDLMASWGVKGVKVDFMERNDAEMVNFYERVAKEASARKMLVNFHSSYPADGLHAKYPNVMTREGVVGLEYNKWSERATPKHQLVIPFLRQWASGMDYTPGSMVNTQKKFFKVRHDDPMSIGTRCHHMAMYVVYESPLQMLSDSPSKYDQSPEWFPFLETVPSVWDETIPLWGNIGEKIAVARRRGDSYFIGAMSAGDACEEEIVLSFLPSGEWKLITYSDGVNAGKNAIDYKKNESTVTSETVIPVKFAPNGGFVAILEKL